MKLILMLTTYALVASSCPFLDRNLPQAHRNVTHVSPLQQFEGQNNTNNKSPVLLLYPADQELITRIKKDLSGPIINILPKVVRFGFHSCVGGCKGCINLDDPDNKGLKEVFDKLEAIYQNGKYGISRADFWATAAMYMIEEAVNRNSNAEYCKIVGGGEDCVPDPRFEYSFGREDCPTSPTKDDTHILPGANTDYHATTGFFRENFNMEPKEVVALLGVHTLGGAVLKNSGFDGQWLEGLHHNMQFNNQFYKQIINPNVDWKQKREDGIDPKTHKPYPWWFKAVNGDGGFRILATISLYRDLKVDGSGEATCSTTNLPEPENKDEEQGDFQECPPSPTEKYFHEFAGSNQKFMEEFAKVYTKMLRN